MKWELIIFIGLPILGLIWTGIIHLQDYIEDRIIKKLGLRKRIEDAYKSICDDLDPQIEQTRKSVLDLRVMSFKKLSGLEDRMLRGKRKTDYINFVFPFGENYKRRR